jgi:hypothetical protein
MDDENEDMSEENDIKDKLEKDDEDIIDPSDEKKPEEKIKKENIISPFSSPIISHKTPPKSFSYIDPIIKLFSKHDRSSSESD